MNGRRPDRTVRWFLRRALGAGPEAESVLGDLEEDFHHLRRRRGAVAARVWYLVEALSLGAGVLLRRHFHLTTGVGDAVEDLPVIEAVTSGGFVTDLRYAVRTIRRDLGLFVFAAVVIALGVGATTATWSVMSPLMVRPLPFGEPDRLVWIANDKPSGGLSGVTSRSSNLRDFRLLAESFSGITGFYAFFEEDQVTLSGTGEPERLAAVPVAHDFLAVLGVEPHLGRGFAADEGVYGGMRRAAILSYGTWRERFDADPAMIGRSIRLNGEPVEVVGVLPRTFDFASVFAPASTVDLLVPYPIDETTDNWGNTLSMIGRLKPGVDAASAQLELDRVVADLKAANPVRWGLGAAVSPLSDQIAGSYRSSMVLLMAASLAVLLIVCVNLSNVLLSKSVGRRREMALRSAMGASRGRLVRQMLLESLMLSAVGGGAGVLLATAVTRWIAASEGVSIPMLRTVELDGAALLVALALTLATGLAIGMVPALQTALSAGASTLRDGGRNASEGPGGRRLREALVVAEVALACVLLVVGGLLLQSLSRVLHVDLGYEPADAAAWTVDSYREFPDARERADFFVSIVEKVERLPGVQAVGLTDAVPHGKNRQWSIRVPGAEAEEEGPQHTSFVHIVDHRYLGAMGIEVLDGRGLRREDDEDGEPVVVLNRTLARELFPGGDAVDREVSLGDSSRLRVAGVVEDVRHRALEQEAGPQFYLPLRQAGDYGKLDMIVRSTMPRETFAASVAEILRDADPGMPTGAVRDLEEVVDLVVSPRRFILVVLASFGAVALLLAALGIYGVLSYSVAERRQEISIRMALGESRGAIRGRVIGRTLALAGIGILLGAAGSVAASRLVGALLYGIDPSDPGTLAATALLLVVVSLAAASIPAVRASRTNSLRVLRSG